MDDADTFINNIGIINHSNNTEFNIYLLNNNYLKILVFDFMYV